MTNKTILLKIIKKAKQNKWKPLFDIKHSYDIEWLQDGYFETFNSQTLIFTRHHINEIIFNIEFAKAFFGTDKTFCDADEKWQFELQELVIKKEPLKYLESFL